jgi:hypothetical protein
MESCSFEDEVHWIKVLQQEELQAMRGDVVNWLAFVQDVVSVTIHRQDSQVDV